MFGNKEQLFRQALDLYEREKLAFIRAALEAPTARLVAEALLRGSLDIQTSASDPSGCLRVISSVSCSPSCERLGCRPRALDARRSRGTGGSGTR